MIFNKSHNLIWKLRFLHSFSVAQPLVILEYSIPVKPKNEKGNGENYSTYYKVKMTLSKNYLKILVVIST